MRAALREKEIEMKGMWVDDLLDDELPEEV